MVSFFFYILFSSRVFDLRTLFFSDPTSYEDDQKTHFAIYRFIRHPVARSSDFSTHPSEGPVIAQFASNDPTEFARAAEMIGPWVNGVDLNCGCPQSWAIKEGIGCSMMGNPEKVAAMIKEAKQRLGSGKSVSCKIRIHPDLKYYE